MSISLHTVDIITKPREIKIPLRRLKVAVLWFSAVSIIAVCRSGMQKRQLQNRHFYPSKRYIVFLFLCLFLSSSSHTCRRGHFVRPRLDIFQMTFIKGRWKGKKIRSTYQLKNHQYRSNFFNFYPYISRKVFFIMLTLLMPLFKGICIVWKSHTFTKSI